MDTSELYLKLAQIPLFIGMGSDELHRLVGKTKLDFQRFSPGEHVVTQGSRCGRMLVLLSGTLEAHCSADDGAYDVTETVAAPAALQIDAMFGLFQRFTHTFTAASSVSLISIGKGELLKLASNSVIFRLNLVNNLSTSLQKYHNDLWRPVDGSLQGRLIDFFRRRVLTPSGQKIFHVKMSTLADIFHYHRNEISHALHDMQDHGLVMLHRGRIEIPAMQKLLSA